MSDFGMQKAFRSTDPSKASRWGSDLSNGNKQYNPFRSTDQRKMLVDAFTFKPSLARSSDENLKPCSTVLGSDWKTEACPAEGDYSSCWEFSTGILSNLFPCGLPGEHADECPSFLYPGGKQIYYGTTGQDECSFCGCMHD